MLPPPQAPLPGATSAAPPTLFSPTAAGGVAGRLAAAVGRRTSIGLAPPPGACSVRPAWWSRADWTGVEVWCVVAAGLDVCRAVHADPHTVVRVARAMAGYADYTTGRDCRPTNTRLADDLAMSIRQIQRARAALKRLHLVVETVRGRSVLTRAERLAVWRRGSAHRRLAAEFALLSVRRRPQPTGLAVGHVTPPGVSPGMSPTSLKSKFFTRPDRTRTGAPRRATTQKGQTGRANRTYPADVRVRRLITGLQHRIYWLRRVSPRRLTALHRFAVAGWTVRDIQTAADEVLRARNWTIPRQIDHPAAYLAALLRHVDPADRPGAAEDAMNAQHKLMREWTWQTTLGPSSCPHEHPGGNIPHPIHGHVACPECRGGPLESSLLSQADIRDTRGTPVA